jgi:SAM-dependent methyltransferase
MDAHSRLIQDQFTRQAIPFATAPAMSDEKALQRLVEFSHATSTDIVLDVACGPGLVAAAFAKAVRSVTGIDLTPAMIARAGAHCHEQGVVNARFQVGDVRVLPFDEGSYSLIVSRFAFHHFLEPHAALAEMVRCCKPGGRILVVDAICSDDPEKAAAWNRVEKWRDPSHVEFRPLDALTGMISSLGLKLLGAIHYPHPVELEALLARSFPAEGDADRIRQAYAGAVEGDRFGVGLRRVSGELRFAYPAVALLAERGA